MANSSVSCNDSNSSETNPSMEQERDQTGSSLDDEPLSILVDLPKDEPCNDVRKRK